MVVHSWSYTIHGALSTRNTKGEQQDGHITLAQNHAEPVDPDPAARPDRLRHEQHSDLDEQVKASWGQVENQYQRRADLIPNLVATVKGYASHEQETLKAVTDARARVGSVQVSDPAQLKEFEAAQNQLSSALSRLMVVVERYPELKADQQFLALQAQLEGTENRISVARRDYIEAVRQFNTEIRTFPVLSGPSCSTRIWRPNPVSVPNPVPMRRPRSASNEDDAALVSSLSAALGQCPASGTRLPDAERTGGG